MLLLISPNHFATNYEALETNTFMTSSKEAIEEQAFLEHNGLIQELSKHNIDFMLYENLNPKTPDALFANNWITVHHSINKIILYPMFLENRRLEVRNDIVKDLCQIYTSLKVHDLRDNSNKALEGTGSMVFDHQEKLIYAAISKRTSRSVLQHVSKLLNYKIVPFYTEYKKCPIYHTNVMMAIGKTWVVVCTEVIDSFDKKDIINTIIASKKYLIEVTISQMEAYCCNILEVYNRDGIPYTVMSEKAKNAFSKEQLEILGNIIAVPFDTIETYGGGGVRCCLTEIE